MCVLLAYGRAHSLAALFRRADARGGILAPPGQRQAGGSVINSGIWRDRGKPGRPGIRAGMAGVAGILLLAVVVTAGVVLIRHSLRDVAAPANGRPQTVPPGGGPGPATGRGTGSRAGRGAPPGARTAAATWPGPDGRKA